MSKIINFIGGTIFFYLSFWVLTFIKDENFFAYFMLIVSTILFIIAAMFYSMILSGPVNKLVKFFVRLAYFVAGVFIICFGIVLMVKQDASTSSIFIFTMLLIEGIYFLSQAFPGVYNKLSDMVYTVDDMNEPINEIYEKFKEVDTPYGHPWIGKVNLLSENCMIYGPTANDSYIYCNYASGRFMITVADNISFLSGNEDLESHRLSEEIGFKDYEIGQIQNIFAMLYPKMYFEMFSHYVKTGETKWVSQKIDFPAKENIYGFEELFAIKKQEYHLINHEGKRIYDVNSDLVRKTFKITDTGTGEEAFLITKRLLHILPTYDFYKSGNKFGTLRQKVAFTRDVFKLKTVDGTVEVQEFNTTLGVNYAVYLNNKLLGIISEKFNFKLQNIVFDNFVLTIFDDRYITLIAGLAIMAQREMVRDREGEI